MNVAAESVPRTMLIAACVALVSSALVTTAVYYLRPMQAAFAAIERNRAIVTASGAPISLPDQAVVTAFLNLRAEVVDLESGEHLNQFDGYTYDHWDTTSNPNPLYVPVYSKIVDGQLNRLILPIHGQGMWSTLYGYLALQGDLNTVAALVIYRHGETPGVGDRIQDIEWLSGWAGKKIRDAEGALLIDVSDDPTIGASYRVDGITGATVTSKAVGKLIRKWLGPDGHGNLLAKLRHQTRQAQ